MRYLLSIATFVVLNVSLSAQTFNRPVPNALFPYEFDLIDTTFHGYYFTTPFFLNATFSSPQFKTPLPLILDEKGYVLLYIPQANVNNTLFRYFPQTKQYSYLRITAASSYYRILDSTFTLIDSIKNTNGILGDGHEFRILSNGNYLIGGRKDSVMDLSNDSIGNVLGSATTTVRGYVIQEFNHITHNLVFQWNSNEHIYPTQGYSQYGYNAAGYDYCHGNSMEEDADGNFIVSFRHLNAVYKIERSTGNVLWILGGKSNQFNFTNDAGFSGQHDVRRLANGHITMFDNENMGAIPKKSRGLEYIIDTAALTATKVWQYYDSIGEFTTALGGNQTLADGSHVINYGMNYRPNVSVSFIDNNDNPISKIYFRDSVMSYRSHVFNVTLPFQRPVITCSQGTGSVTLTAPSGFTKYAWSNGSTTQSITLTAAGSYQVWVNNGITMVGSLPAIITDITTYCLSTAVGETAVSDYEIVPNPFEDKIIITMNSPQMLRVAVYDIASRKIMEQEITSTAVINTTEFAKGIYFYELKTENGIVKKGKLVKN